MDERKIAGRPVRGQPAPICARSPTGCSARPSEADDAVQETWLRLSRADTPARREPRRLADDGGRAGLPGHAALAQVAPRGADGPARAGAVARRRRTSARREMADSVGAALLVVLETLAPAERLAFVLHDMFAVPFEEIAPIVGRTPAAARQLGQPRPPPRAGRAERRMPDLSPGSVNVDGRVPRGVTRRRFRRTARRARSRRRVPRRSGRAAARHRWRKSAARRRWPKPSRDARRRHAPRWSMAKTALAVVIGGQIRDRAAAHH